MDNTYYETTLKFLLVEYYKCVKNQNELIDSIPIDFKKDDKMVILTIYLLYANAYAKKRIFKEILDLVLYNASFLISLKVDALMKEDMTKNYNSNKLEPNPQVEELTGGGNIVFLQAIMFLSFMFFYQALSQESQESQLTVFSNSPPTFSNSQSHNVEFSDDLNQVTVPDTQSYNVDVKSYDNIGDTIKFTPRNYAEVAPTSYETLSKGINKRNDDFVFDSKNPLHMKSYTQRYGDFTIGKNSQLTKFIDENMDRKLPLMQRWFGKNEYIKDEIAKINPFIRNLFTELKETCLQVVEKREDQLPLELEKRFNSTLINMSKDYQGQFKIVMDAIKPADIKKMAETELSQQNFNYEKNKPKSGTDTSNRPVNVNVSPTGTFTDEDVKNKGEEIKNRLSDQAKQKILEENLERATKSILEEAAEQLNESNKRSFFNSACRKWFGNVPQLEFNEENQTLSISDSAESFSSLKIILENIMQFANKVPKNDENNRKILIQKAKFLNEFIDNYNVLIYNIFDKNQKFTSIQEFTLELRKLVNKLYNEVKFISENSFPDDFIKTYSAIQSNQELQQFKTAEANSKVEINTQYYSDKAKVYTSNLQGLTGVILNTTLDSLEHGVNKMTDTTGNIGINLIEKTGEVADVAGDQLSGLVYKYMIPGGLAIVGALSMYVIFMHLRLYYLKEEAKLKLGYNQPSNNQLTQPQGQFQPGQYQPRPYQQFSYTQGQFQPGQYQPSNNQLTQPQGQFQPGQYQPSNNQLTQPQGQFQQSQQQNFQGQNQRGNLPALGRDDIFYEETNRGGKKTRKRAKKGTRKLKRGKRRQTRHRTGRKTKRR
jgi:hypothetical protein